MSNSFFVVIRNDFANAMNQFLATFYEFQYKTEYSKTYLYIPKEILDKSIDELIKDKAIVTRLDGKSFQKIRSIQIGFVLSGFVEMASPIQRNSSYSRSFDEFWR